ncbi:MAG: thioredoxin-dependent thiol peroxidase [Minisyncoccia bacterium]
MNLAQMGKKAPSFSLPDQNGKKHRLSEYSGKYILLYFYPKDDTPGCTKEACMLRDNFPAFKKLGITVFGVSADDEKSHKKFEEKYSLPFTLLSDADHMVAEAYGAWGLKKFMGREYDGIHRVSFLINPEGKIAKVYEKVKPEAHAEGVLADLKELMK